MWPVEQRVTACNRFKRLGLPEVRVMSLLEPMSKPIGMSHPPVVVAETDLNFEWAPAIPKAVLHTGCADADTGPLNIKSVQLPVAP